MRWPIKCKSKDMKQDQDNQGYDPAVARLKGAVNEIDNEIERNSLEIDRLTQRNESLEGTRSSILESIDFLKQSLPKTPKFVSSIDSIKVFHKTEGAIKIGSTPEKTNDKINQYVIKKASWKDKVLDLLELEPEERTPKQISERLEVPREKQATLRTSINQLFKAGIIVRRPLNGHTNAYSFEGWFQQNGLDYDKYESDDS